MSDNSRTNGGALIFCKLIQIQTFFMRSMATSTDCFANLSMLLSFVENLFSKRNRGVGRSPIQAFRVYERSKSRKKKVSKETFNKLYVYKLAQCQVPRAWLTRGQV